MYQIAYIHIFIHFTYIIIYVISKIYIYDTPKPFSA